METRNWCYPDEVQDITRNRHTSHKIREATQGWKDNDGRRMLDARACMGGYHNRYFDSYFLILRKKSLLRTILL